MLTRRTESTDSPPMLDSEAVRARKGRAIARRRRNGRGRRTPGRRRGAERRKAGIGATTSLLLTSLRAATLRTEFVCEAMRASSTMIRRKVGMEEGGEE